ncbi:MAG: RIP metalloprotease RseP [Planctomycetota bacterium]|nr:RIP metalloprotease RseP [Planctomycetota bacterium]
MEILAAFGLSNLVSIFSVVLGLGFVIFFHEFGHFAVAKWCNVYVERFSIGFGPVIWSWQKGETEYALSVIPFGGYVKMLGQDDMDPSQLTSDEIAENPRSYSAKAVWQRMAIISAGVIMNIVTGMLFFAFAYQMGVKTSPSIVGSLSTGSPAWVAGFQQGDRFTHVNGEKVATFRDVLIRVALSTDETINLKGIKSDGTPFDIDVVPDSGGTRRMLGFSPTVGLSVAELEDEDISPTTPGSSASQATPPFQSGDLIRQLQGQDVKSFPEFQGRLARMSDKQVQIAVQRKGAADGELETITVEPNRFYTLGLTMVMGPITEIRNGSPAQRKTDSLQVGDKITSIEVEAGENRKIDPLKLPEELAVLAGQDVTIHFQRGTEQKEAQLTLVPEDRPGWIERPILPHVSLSAPAIGVAYRVLPFVSEVAAGSPADKAGVKSGARIVKVTMTRPEDAPKDLYLDGKVEIDFEKKNDGEENKTNWAYAFARMQNHPSWQISLTFKNPKSDPQTVEIAAPEASGDWFNPTRGIRMQQLVEEMRAESFGDAISMGRTHTVTTAVQIYLTLRSLARRDISYKELHGPIGIATVAYRVAKDGFPELLLFLGFLSVNLAVLNFLPIPVLDGGHMVFLLWEAVTRRRPSERVLVAATYVGIAFVLSLMVLVLWLDIFVHWLGY